MVQKKDSQNAYFIWSINKVTKTYTQLIKGSKDNEDQAIGQTSKNIIMSMKTCLSGSEKYIYSCIE